MVPGTLALGTRYVTFKHAFEGRSTPQPGSAEKLTTGLFLYLGLAKHYPSVPLLRTLPGKVPGDGSS